MHPTFSEPFIRTTRLHAAWGVEQLEVFNEFMPTGPWSADLDRGVYRQSGRDLKISVLGSYDSSDHSWLWGWANPGFKQMPVVAAGETVRRYGQSDGIREFTEELLDLSWHEEPRRAVETVAFAAMGVLGAAGYIGVEAGPGTRLYMVPDDPRIPRATPEPVALPRVLTTGAGIVGGPARPAVAGYFTHHGLTQRQEPDRIRAELPSGSTVAVSFDGLGRIAAVEVGSLGSAAPGPTAVR